MRKNAYPHLVFSILVGISLLPGCAGDVKYSVGGQVSGLNGVVVLQNNGGDALSVSTNGAFTFPNPVLNGSSYNVTVKTQPSGQTCIPSNNTGTVQDANVTSVSVICDTETKIGPFVASYYSDATFIASESVSHPSINYVYSNFGSIDSTTFHAIWTGNVEVFGSSAKTIDINFDVSWSDISLSIDGANIASWSNTDRTIQHQFSPGVHQIRIEYFNNWPTTDFYVSFTTNRTYTKDEAKSLIASKIDGNTKIVYVGCYESAELYHNSLVTLQNASSNLFLFLSCYDSLNWVIDNPYNFAISGIAYGSNSGAATVTANATIPTFEIAGLAYGYSDFSGPSSDITYLTGRAPDYTYGAYGLTQVTISLP